MFELVSPFAPAGDQPQAIARLTENLVSGAKHQTLLGVTGSGKTFTVANVIAQVNRPTLALLHHKTRAFCVRLCCVDAGPSCCDSAAMKVQFDPENLNRFCRERGIARLELFGSALRDNFREDSDVDLLCSLRPDAHPTLFDWADMQEKLAEMFGRPVDLVSRRAIESSKNWIRRQSILSHTMPLYEE